MLGDIDYVEAGKNVEGSSYKKALENYRDAADLSPYRVALQVKLGQCFEKVRDFEEAIVCYSKALRRDKTNFMSHYRLGCVQIKNGMRQEGIESLMEAHRIEPDDVDTLVKLGEIFSRDDGKMNQAIKMVEKALAIDPEIPDAYVTLGRIYEKQGKEEDAME